MEQNEADRNDIQRVELEGAKCLISEKQLASFDVFETETNVIDSRKKLNAMRGRDTPHNGPKGGGSVRKENLFRL